MVNYNKASTKFKILKYVEMFEIIQSMFLNYVIKMEISNKTILEKGVLLEN